LIVLFIVYNRLRGLSMETKPVTVQFAPIVLPCVGLSPAANADRAGIPKQVGEPNRFLCRKEIVNASKENEAGVDVQSELDERQRDAS
jgi:hypothetical protein